MKYEWIVEIDDDEDFHLEEAKWKQELVRCKDCRFHEHEEPGMVWCPNMIGSWMADDGYCSRGERRKDAETN